MHGIPIRAARVILLAGLMFSSTARADEPIVVQPPLPVSFVDRATATAQDAIDQAMDLLGIRYRRGGSSPEAGFDCSGFVSHVFREGLGLVLPRSSKEMSKSGEEIGKDELRPGDLVFFNTMRRAFSHVGIYLGDNQFVHAPRSGGRVRIEDLRDSYWNKRFNGARRVKPGLTGRQILSQHRAGFFWTCYCE
jgi:cell wall-associated NlpC family hydrolase